MTTETIPYPDVGLTLQPPWPQAIAFAGKRLENREKNVASAAKAHVGATVLLSQSKMKPPARAMHDQINREAAELETAMDLTESSLGDLQQILDAGATAWLVAELQEILSPGLAALDPWHTPGQHGLVLGRVWQVEPVPCTGGVGLWTVEWCHFCGHIYATTSSHKGQCKTCGKQRYLVDGDRDDRPRLAVVKECV